MEKKRTKKRPARLSWVLALVLICLAAAVTAGCSNSGQEAEPAGSSVELLPVGWPSSLQGEVYVEPPFEDVPGRTNNAFNVADFGDQGSNGWFYRYGKATKPTQSRRMETLISGSYKQTGLDGLEIKSDFVHTATGTAPILEWRAAEDGAVNVALTYVKNVNGDSNPSFPDGVKLYLYKGEEMLKSHQVDVYTDRETLLETGVEDLEVKKGESLYFAVDPNSNNAYDGGLLYIAINDVNTPEPTVRTDGNRLNNDANNVADYGYQGKNGWTYLYGKDVSDCHLVSTETADGYMNATSPALVIKGDFIHPAINDKAILGWTPAVNGTVEVRGKYTKFEQNDGNPDWPDGVTVQIYLNQKKLYEKAVPAPAEGTESVEFRHVGLSVTPNDRLYFVVSANGNSSYDGGSFDITILDRNCRTTENDIAIDESEIRQNIADVQSDFGPQGSNGWFFQEGYKDEPYGALNIKNYIPGDKYYDDHYLELKRDYANVGENGRSPVVKWKVAQDGVIRIDASYTKAPNQDANPDWPDGTRVCLWHNGTRLTSQTFAPLTYEVRKDLSVSRLNVRRGDTITMTINGLDNNAYDGGNFHFSIMTLSGLTGPTEDDVAIPGDADRTNNADVSRDFGAQGQNGWFYQYGYNTDPFFAINVEKYNEGESYTTKDGIEIKRDYIMPSTKGKCAQVKWKVAQDGKVNVLADYTKLLNEDANPSWPDGTTVTLLYGKTVLRQEYFAPDTAQEVKKDLSVANLTVKKGEVITLIVNGGGNTAYDGGLYHFKIEDATYTTPGYTPDTDNTADLADDFTGSQGAGGWYYAEGRTPEQANELTKKTDDGAGFQSASEPDLQIKKDFVQPGADKAAMYQWVAGAEGKIDVVGSYTKFGHQDGNPSWPDGTHVTIYLNGTELLSEDVDVREGDGNNNVLRFALNNSGAGLDVKKGDILTFMVGARSNVAWDGGRMDAQILPHEAPPAYEPGEDNNTDLAGAFGAQGSDGWYYGYSVNGAGADFAPASLNGEAYTSALYSGLELKKDGVQPAAEAGAVYRWVAAEDGEIWLDGAYTKFKNENPEDTAPDGVRVAVYLNGQPVDGMSYDVAVSTSQEVRQELKNTLTVSAGDKLDFVITAKANNAWDYGRLEMSITDRAPYVPSEPPYENNASENRADLAADFSGAQGAGGWYYGVCDWDGNGFATVDMRYSTDDGGKWLYNGGRPDLRKDFVEPGSGKSAAYLWVAAQDGEIRITGSYTKYPNTADPNADGVSFRIFKNPGDSNVLLFANSGIQGSVASNGVVDFDKAVSVVKGDKLIFAVNPENNDSYDSGKLAVTIEPTVEPVDPVDPVEPVVLTTLAGDFSGAQGGKGWSYGYCDWDGNGFSTDGMVYAGGEGWRFNGGNPQLKSDYVHPEDGKCAAYRWTASEKGVITVSGSYTKHPNADDPNANGVTFRIFQNPGDSNVKFFAGGDQGIQGGGITEDRTVSFRVRLEVEPGDQIIFSVNAEGNSAYDGGSIAVTIYSGDPSDASAAAAVPAALPPAAEPLKSGKAD